MLYPRPSTIEPPLQVDERGPYLPIPDHNFVTRWIDTADLTAAELDDLVELIRRAFNGGASWFHYGVAPVDHLRWKTVDTPYRCRAAWRELLDGGPGGPAGPIGVGFSHHQRFLIEGHERTGLQHTDLALDPSVQGRGFHTAMNKFNDATRQVRADVDVSVGWGVRHPIWDHLRQQERDPHEIDLANHLITYAKPLTWSGLKRRRPTRPEQAGESRTRDELSGHRRKVTARQVVSLAVAQLRAALHHARAPRGVRGDWRIETVDALGPEADVFWADACTQFDFLQVRDREYLNWRYCDRRAGPFELRVAKSGDLMLGYAAIRADEGEAVLADILTLPGRLDVAGALLDDAIALARRAGSPAMRLWLQHRHPYAQAVRQRGFFDTDQQLSVRLRRFWDDSPELPFADDPSARVHATIGDSDHV